jgi:hypothetical protein
VRTGDIARERLRKQIYSGFQTYGEIVWIVLAVEKLHNSIVQQLALVEVDQTVDRVCIAFL